MQTRTATNSALLAAVEAVQRAATPRRDLTLTDEFGRFHGRPFLIDTADVAACFVPRPRAAIAFEVA